MRKIILSTILTGLILSGAPASPQGGPASPLGGPVAFAAVPTLQDFESWIPRPVYSFWQKASNFDISFHFQDDGTSKFIQFFKFVGQAFLGLLRGVGSVFVWIFQTIANGLESLIFSR